MRRGRQARRVFDELGDGILAVVADVAGHALARGSELIGSMGAGLPEAEMAGLDPVREGAVGVSASGPGAPMVVGEDVAPPMADIKAPLTTDGAANCRLPTPAAHGGGDGIPSTAPCRPGKEASARQGGRQAAPMRGAPAGSLDETVCGRPPCEIVRQAASSQAGGAVERPADVSPGDAAEHAGRCRAAAGAGSPVAEEAERGFLSCAEREQDLASRITARGLDKPAGCATEAANPVSPPLVAVPGAGRAVVTENAGMLIAAADAERPTVPGDGALSVAAVEEMADLASVRLEKDLAALIATRGLLASRRIGRSWAISGRAEQKPPEHDWGTWLVIGGRGSGKTRAGAEWVQGLAMAAGPRTDLRIALIAETLGDAREVMIDGASGIARIARRLRPEVEISRRRIVWPNGAIAQIFSSEDPESLRGPQFHYAWCDELAKWKHAEDTFDMLQFALRLGTRPRQLVTTTPRAVPLLKRLMGDADTVVSRLSTADNRPNLAPGFIAALERRYGGTRLGRQELGGELIEDREDALWRRDRLEALTVRLIEPLRRIVVAVDPPAGSGPASVCGIVVAGLMDNARAAVLADCSVEGQSPADWARAVVAAFRRFEADRVVAEVNQGGDMVSAMLKSVDARLPLSLVRATRGKFLRAEPVAALYEQGRVVHAGRFVELEDQMCDFGPEGLSSGRSPDRLDALVWALTALMLEGPGEPRIRGV